MNTSDIQNSTQAIQTTVDLATSRTKDILCNQHPIFIHVSDNPNNIDITHLVSKTKKTFWVGNEILSLTHSMNSDHISITQKIDGLPKTIIYSIDIHNLTLIPISQIGTNIKSFVIVGDKLIVSTPFIYISRLSNPEDDIIDLKATSESAIPIKMLLQGDLLHIISGWSHNRSKKSEFTYFMYHIPTNKMLRTFVLSIPQYGDAPIFVRYFSDNRETEILFSDGHRYLYSESSNRPRTEVWFTECVDYQISPIISQLEADAVSICCVHKTENITKIVHIKRGGNHWLKIDEKIYHISRYQDSYITCNHRGEITIIPRDK